MISICVPILPIFIFYFTIKLHLLNTHILNIYHSQLLNATKNKADTVPVLLTKAHLCLAGVPYQMFVYIYIILVTEIYDMYTKQKATKALTSISLKSIIRD